MEKANGPEDGAGNSASSRAASEYITILEKNAGKEEADKKIVQKVEEFHGMLTQEAAAKLIASELGLVKESLVSAAELKEGMVSVNFEGEIAGIGKKREFPSGAVLRTVILKDESGEAGLNFWGEDAKKSAGLHIGDRIEVKNAYLKMGKLNLGYRGTSKIKERAEAVPLPELEVKRGKVMVMGKIGKIEGDKGGEFLFSISGGGKTIDVSLRNSPGKGKHLQEGDSILLEGAEFKDGKLVVDGRARMLLKKNRDNIVRGELQGIEIDGETAILKVDGKNFVCGRNQLIKFLNMKDIKKDIDLHTVLKMRLPEIMGRNALVFFSRDGGRKKIEHAELR
ncbi:hypothetical protein GF415_00195 [Candidatus Micrarchaeota archaeon]|nr:hypothetical protein [Candidatus Micrarchaeota archaeon]